jgi:hypothetical protein
MMNSLLRTGITIVVFALASYSTAIITQIRRRSLTTVMRVFLTAGVTLDATSTGFMIAGSSRMPFSFHGVLGYSALLLMAIDLVLMWRFYAGNGAARIPRGLHRYSIIAYSWWLMAFVAGTIIVSRL